MQAGTIQTPRQGVSNGDICQLAETGHQSIGRARERQCYFSVKVTKKVVGTGGEDVGASR